MDERKNRSTMSELDETADQIKECYHRLEQLERNLRYRPMTNEQREATEKDVEELKKILKKQEDELVALRKENRGSTLTAVLLIIVSFVIFGIYYSIVTTK